MLIENKLVKIKFLIIAAAAAMRCSVEEVYGGRRWHRIVIALGWLYGLAAAS